MQVAPTKQAAPSEIYKLPFEDVLQVFSMGFQLD